MFDKHNHADAVTESNERGKTTGKVTFDFDPYFYFYRFPFCHSYILGIDYEFFLFCMALLFKFLFLIDYLVWMALELI